MNDIDKQLHWFSNVMTLLTQQRWWHHMLPPLIRRRREAELLLKAGLFDGESYLQANPDVAQARMDPFRHFVFHGLHEGRVRQVARLVDDQSDRSVKFEYFRFGGREYRPELGTLLIANHDSSRTGAPLVGLNLARELGERWNVFTFVGRAEALIDEFEKHCCGLVVGWRNEAEQAGLIAELVRLYGLQCVVVNSVEASGLVSAAVRGGVGVVALIHEFADYTAPFGRTTDAVRLADRVIVPADLVAQSLQAEIEAICGGRAPNIVVRRQGALPWLPGVEVDGPERSTGMSADEIRSYVAERSGGPRRIVLGAGYVGQRKGVDLFVQTAAEVARERDDVAFVWVGDGYAPRTDMAYSIWIDQMVRRMGLEHVVHFLPGQPSLDASFEVSDAFYLPSRLDPFPNVVIDALHASVGVVCFEGATGCAELFGPEKGLVGAAVPHCDVAAAAKALLALLDDPGRAAGNAAAAERSFAFADYVADIEREIALARASAAEREAAAQRILASGTLNTAFYQARAGGNALAAVRDYVASSRHGLARRNPCPGFNDSLWQARADHQPGRAALDEALEAGRGTMIPTHVCHRLGRGGARAIRAIRDEQPLTGLHIHFHYSELAVDFARRLEASGMKVDVIATVTSEHGRRETEYAFRNYAGGSVETVEVPNRGRDVGPLLVDLAGRFDDYDIVGHLHAKRSLVIGAAAGDAWREFLLDTLLGDDNGVLAEILTLFAHDAKLGLIFPEDPHNVGWSQNRSYGEALAARMSPRPTITERPVFPIGTMFWARRAVLEPFWNLHLTRQDLPTEPLPYDGSILHAVERLIPDTCKALGLDWNTIHLNSTRR